MEIDLDNLRKSDTVKKAIIMEKKHRKGKKSNQTDLWKTRKEMAEVGETKLIKPRKMEWWERPLVKYAFTDPNVRCPLEKLMGSNIVRLTDREYMQKLQVRIYEDHLEMQQRRMLDREAEEVEREKKLILEGKLPLEEASQQLMDHPVFQVSRLTKKIIEEKRSKMKPAFSVTSSHISMYEEDIAAREAEQAAATTRSSKDLEAKARQCKIDDDEPYMFSQEVYDKMKYESPLVKQLRTLETVEEMYEMADKIIGPLRTLKKRQHCVE